MNTNEIFMKFSRSQIQRFLSVFDAYQRQGGSTREKYRERLEIEFRRDGLTKSDLDSLDAYYQKRRWLK